MTDKYTEMGEKHNFFSNREIWEQVFGQDGRGGVIKELDDKIEDKFSGLESMVCEEFKNLSKKLDEYNGLRESLYEVNEAVEEHIDFCKERVEESDKESFKTATYDENFSAGKTEAFREIKQFIAIITVCLAILGTLAGVLINFVF